ncbi:MAG: FeoB small GTPase domain-containing protein [Spirochaetia bacterium]
MTRIAVVGLPNSGKSQLCNSLTGTYELVSNYPQTTISVATHRIRVEGCEWEVADTPGLHGLFIQSEEELVVRTLLYERPPDVLVQCVDANRFRESLLLTADLLGLGIPLVLVVTAVGETARKGIQLDMPRLGRLLGLPVLASARPGAGVTELRRLLLGTIPAPPPLDFGGLIEKAVARAEELLPSTAMFPRASALLFLENDPSFVGAAGNGHSALMEEVRTRLAGTAPRLIAERRNAWVDDVAGRVFRKNGGGRGAPRFSETFARMCRHPLYGLPILAFFLGLIYVMVVYVAGALSLFLTVTVTDPVVRGVGMIVPRGFWNDLLIGPHGLLTLGLFNSLTTVLPILSVFFLVFGILEDIGYLPNLAILTRKVSAKLGITGNAVIPLVLGFGCKTMATMTARTIQSRKEKLIVIALIAFAIPCSAQMGLSIAILGAHGVRYFVAAFGLLAVAELIAGLLLNRLLPADAEGQFIQELPPIRVPRLSAVARKTGYRLLWFLKEAIPIFLIAALAMFAIDTLGLLALLKTALKPFITGWLGLPLDMVDALLLTFARSEAAAGLILRMAHAGVLNGPQSILAVILITTFAQCFANITAMFREVRARAALLIIVSIYAASFLYTGAVRALLAAAGGALGL